MPVLWVGCRVGHMVGQADHHRLRERHLETGPVAPTDEQPELGRRVGEHRRDLASFVEQDHHFPVDRHVEHAGRQAGGVGEVGDDQRFVGIGQPDVALLVAEAEVDDVPATAQAGRRNMISSERGSS